MYNSTDFNYYKNKNEVIQIIGTESHYLQYSEPINITFKASYTNIFDNTKINFDKKIITQSNIFDDSFNINRYWFFKYGNPIIAPTKVIEFDYSDNSIVIELPNNNILLSGINNNIYQIYVHDASNSYISKVNEYSIISNENNIYRIKLYVEFLTSSLYNVDITFYFGDVIKNISTNNTKLEFSMPYYIYDKIINGQNVAVEMCQIKNCIEERDNILYILCNCAGNGINNSNTIYNTFSTYNKVFLGKEEILPSTIKPHEYISINDEKIARGHNYIEFNKNSEYIIKYNKYDYTGLAKKNYIFNNRIYIKDIIMKEFPSLYTRDFETFYDYFDFLINTYPTFTIYINNVIIQDWLTDENNDYYINIQDISILKEVNEVKIIMTEAYSLPSNDIFLFAEMFEPIIRTPKTLSDFFYLESLENISNVSIQDSDTRFYYNYKTKESISSFDIIDTKGSISIQENEAIYNNCKSFLLEYKNLNTFEIEYRDRDINGNNLYKFDDSFNLISVNIEKNEIIMFINCRIESSTLSEGDQVNNKSYNISYSYQEIYSL